MVGKQLSALLQILRSQGVVEYESTELRLRLGPVAGAKAGSRVVNLSPEALDADREADEEDDEDGDPRFLLERLQQKHFPGRRSKAEAQ